MIKRILAASAATVALTLAGPALAALTPQDIAGAAAMLQLYGPTVTPKTTADGASLNIATTGTRTQVVYISGAVFSSPAGPVREVYSFAAHLTGGLDAALALRLLVESDKMLPGGAWAATAPSDGSHYLVYEAYLPTGADAATVQRTVTAAALTTDKLEAELSDKDTY